MGKLTDKFIWNGLLGPRNKRLFKIRIGFRVWWLYRMQAWNNFKTLEFLRCLPRPVLLLFFGTLPLICLIGWDLSISGNSGFYYQFKKFITETETVPTWRDVTQPLLITLGLPAAFIIWAYRDWNAQKSLENDRKDINLREFQEIQMRAAGAIDDKFPSAAQQTLQIAAIHQLRPFLRGEYGNSFRRPAWEFLKSTLEFSAEEIGYNLIINQIKDISNHPLNKPKVVDFDNIDKLDNIKSRPAFFALRELLQEESDEIFSDIFPKHNFHLDNLTLESKLLSNVNLSHASLIRTNFINAHLEKVILDNTYLMAARFENAYLERASFVQTYLTNANFMRANMRHASIINSIAVKAHFWHAKLEYADLSNSYFHYTQFREANLQGTNLINTYLSNTLLRKCKLEGANLTGAFLYNADLSEASFDKNTKMEGSVYNENTVFSLNWENLSEGEKEETRKPWRDLGMVYEKEPKFG